MKTEYSLDDNVIAEIARLLQVALLTGTDIIDNLRTIKVERTGDLITLHEAYVGSQNENIERMLSEAAELQRSGVDEITLGDTNDDEVLH